MTIEERLERIERALGFWFEIKSIKKPLSGRKVAVVVGHHRLVDKGSYSVDGVSEQDYNRVVANLLSERLQEAGAETLIYKESNTGSYSESVSIMAKALRSFNAEIGVELHFNSADGFAEDEEYLYYERSEPSKFLAESLSDAHNELDPDPKTRGIKPRSSGRGYQALVSTHCPYVICEPFFGDNKSDWDFWKNNQILLSEIYFNGILNFFKEHA